MTLNEYQKRAMETCMPSCENFSYLFLNLVGEVGEFASKVAKLIRKGKMSVNFGQLTIKDLSKEETYENEEALMKEAGDILWQLSGLCENMGWSLEYVAQTNLEKLAQRKRNGTIDGSGDGVTKEERK